ncbi:hypothetical protein RJT34_22189 [Clitoria ternatea]|uniref:DUF674 family protein n=1 Tax=Clitoria ternatea TaxID=43366 RepID=A0AAN9IV30_CLITE
MAQQQNQQQEQEQPTIPLKILFDKENNKVIAVEATQHFVDTLFSFLSLPLGTIIRLLRDQNNPQQLIGNINNLYQSVQNLTPNDVWNNVCKQMLLHPRNPCEALCSRLVLNVDDTEPSTGVFLVCDSCNKFTTFRNMDCTCGKPANKIPKNLDSEGNGNSNGDARGGVFVRENGSLFLVLDDLTVVPSSFVTSMELLLQLGYSDLTQLEVVTRNITKQEILNLLKYTLISHEPLTNTILGSGSKKKDNPANQFASTVRASPSTSIADNKMDVKLIQSKSQKKIIFAEVNEDFVDFIFSFLTVPLGSIVKLLGGNTFVGCVDNLYKSVETLDSSWCTESRSVLLNPGVAPQFSCPKQPLNIPNVETPPIYYYYGEGTFEDDYPFNTRRETIIEGGVISKSDRSIISVRRLTALDPRSPKRLKESVVGFVKRPALYAVGDDLIVKSVSSGSCLVYLKELSLPLDDLEMKVISIGEAEALSLLAASLTSKFTLTSGLKDFLDVPKQESSLTSKYTQTSRLDDLLKEPKPQA